MVSIGAHGGHTCRVTKTPQPRRRSQRIEHPGVLVVAAFVAVIALGSALLALPVAHRGPSGVGIGDAVFTASSAVTVTGLVVTDTRTVWSPFGETVLIALIQIGGLGIMTLGGFLGIAFNRRLGVRSGLLAGADIGLSELGALRTMLGNIARFVFGSEAVIAIALTVRFLSEGDQGLWRSIHLAVFHSVSAFNNAGFSIIDGGLERYVSDWAMNLIIVSAFVVGGIGFPVVFELKKRWRTPRRWSLHTKVTLFTSAALLSLGTIAIAITEWTNDNSMGDLKPTDKVLASFFQSATARTAGFNTVPIGELRQSSWMLLILLMVIGAGSASTGGGIKVSTFAVVLRSTLSEFRRDPTTSIFHRRISLDTQRKALALVVAALGTVGTATFLLTATHSDIALSELLFESASAFGTVGISTGVTDELNGVGRLLIIVLMFIGRVGPITFGTAVLLRAEPRRYGYAEEDLVVG